MGILFLYVRRFFVKAPRRFASASFFVMLFIAIIIAFAVFKIAASVLIPLAIALMLSIVIEPLIIVLNKRLHLPKFLCIILIMLGALVAIASIGTLLVNSFRTILTQYPRYESRFLIIYETIAIVSPFVNTVFYKSSVDFLLFFKLITYQLGHFYL